MYPDLQGKAVVVTGSSKGIGAAVALRFAQEGANVVVNYNGDAQGAQNVVAQIEAAGAKGVAVQGDMSKEAGAAGLVQATLDAFGRLDVWVNNAGLEIPAHTHEMTLENWQKVIDMNLTGYFLGARAALKHFVANGIKGSIINMSSVHEQIPWPRFAHYAASKGGVKLLNETMAMNTRRWASV